MGEAKPRTGWLGYDGHEGAVPHDPAMTDSFNEQVHAKEDAELARLEAARRTKREAKAERDG